MQTKLTTECWNSLYRHDDRLEFRCDDGRILLRRSDDEELCILWTVA